MVVTDHDNQASIEKLARRVRIMPPYVPDPKVFNPTGRETRERQVLALIGKTNYYWQDKGLHRVIDIWSKLNDHFEFLVVSQGNGVKSFKSYILNKLGDRVRWQPFIEPWRMPALLKAIDGIFYFQKDLPFPMFSNLAVEALYCGTALIVDRSDILEQYLAYGIDLEAEKNLIVEVPPKDPSKSALQITNHFEGLNKIDESLDHPDYLRYLLLNKEIILSVSSRKLD
jgi:hypothetical protein